jgi:hypothetical protein
MSAPFAQDLTQIKIGIRVQGCGERSESKLIIFVPLYYVNRTNLINRKARTLSITLFN